MNITFIKPNIGFLENGRYIDRGRMEPLNIGVLAGLTPKEIEVHFYDDRIENIPFDEPTDLAAITVETYTAKRSYDIAANFRRRGVKVILGGMHPTLFPEEAALHADAVYTGDAEYRWHEVIEDMKQGQLKLLYRAPVGIPHLQIFPRKDIFHGKGYLPISLSQFSRGCMFKCNFCATSVYFNQKHYVRLPDHLCWEIERQWKKIFFFVDDNFTANRLAAKVILKQLIPLNIKWVGQISIDVTQDLELVDLLQKSGCLGFVVGFESLSLDNLQSMNKSPNTARFQNYEEQIKILRDHGFQIWAAFTIGHDFDTRQSIEDTLAFTLKQKFAFAAFNILMPYPGTPLYEKFQSENRLLYNGKWWLHPDYRFNHASFVPKHMDPEELTHLAYQMKLQFNKPSSVIKRMLNIKLDRHSFTRFGILLKYSTLFTREVLKKQNMRFGMRK